MIAGCSQVALRLLFTRLNNLRSLSLSSCVTYFSLACLNSPPLDPLRSLNTPLDLRTSELNPVFSVASLGVSTGCKNFPQSAGLAIPDAAQYAFCFTHDASMLLAFIHLGIHGNPQVLFSIAAIQPVSPDPELMHGIILPQRQNYGLLVEVFYVGCLLKIMKVCGESRCIVCLVGRSADLVLSSNLPVVPCFIKCHMLIAHC